MSLIMTWIFASLSLFIISKILSGFRIKNVQTAVVASAVYGIVHLLLSKILTLFSLPLMILTLGLFSFVIDAILLKVTDMLIEDFEIDGFGTAVLVAFLLSLLNMLWRGIFF